MPLTRRDFITGTGTALAATLVPGRLLAAIEKHTPPPASPSSWSAVRSLFPLTREYLHFASFFIASHPRPVRDAIEGFRRALDANPFLTVERGLFESEAQNLQLRVLEDMAPYLGARPDEIALTPNTTTGLALVYHGLPLEAGDEIVTTTHDHFVHHESIRYAAERSGATVRKIALFDDAATATAASIAARIRSAVGRKTRAVGVTWVHSSTGIRLPIREIAAAVREANRGRAEKDRAVLVVDGVHGLGAVDETIAETGCDYFCAGTHKWIFAPRGTGLLWAKPEGWARLRPTIPSLSSLDLYQAWMAEKPATGPNTAARVSPGGFLAFEHQWAAGAAFRLHRQIGRDRVGARIRALNDQCKEGLASIRGVRIHTPRDPDLSAGIVCFEVAGIEPPAVVAKLLERKIVASTSPYRVSYVRLAPSLVNDPAEVDQALRALRSVAVT